MLQQQLGLPSGVAEMMACMLAAYPLSFMMLAIWPQRWLPAAKDSPPAHVRTLKTLATALPGVAFLWVCFGWSGVAQTLAHIVAAYGLIWLVIVRPVSKPSVFAPVIVFALSLAHLCYLYVEF
jgi:hypothetical protein